MPAYNAEATIAEAMESVLAQDFTQFELLLLDDGSADRTRQIAERLAARDRRIKVISRNKRGIVASLNELCTMARAPLIARMDADDICEPQRLSKQVAFLDDHPGYGLVGCRASAIDQRGRTIARLAATIACTHEEIVSALEQHNPIYHPAVLIRRNLLLRAGGYRPAYRGAEDYDLWLRLSEMTRLANLPERLLRYRFHPQQVSSIGLVGQARTSAIAWLAHLERRSGRPDPTSGSAALPAADRLDALFGKGSAEIVRARVFEQIVWSPAVRRGDAWPIALVHARDPGEHRAAYRIALAQMRAGRVLSALRIIGALLARVRPVADERPY